MNNTDWRTPGVVLACGSIILMLSLRIRQNFGLFLQPTSGDFGWGRETFAFALALQNLIWGVAQPFAGMVADKFGAARVMVAVGLGVLAAILCLPIDERELARLPLKRPAV
jgi:sugar phosphate permease